MPTAIVTGSGGLVGSESVRYFVEAGYDVVGLDNDMRAWFFGPSATTQPVSEALAERFAEFQLIDLDIRDADAVDLLFARQPRTFRSSSIRRHSRRTIGRRRIRRRTSPSTRTDAQPAGGGAQARSRRDVREHVDQQGLRRPRKPPATASNSRLGSSCRRTTIGTQGIDTTMSIDSSTHSLFGVSKAAGDLLAQEYGRYFDMPTVCFRGGCLTGPTTPAPRLHGFLSYLMRCTIARQSLHDLRLRGKAGPRQPSQRRPGGGVRRLSRRPARSRGLQHRGRAVQQLLGARGDRDVRGDR